MNRAYIIWLGASLALLQQITGIAAVISGTLGCRAAKATIGQAISIPLENLEPALTFWIFALFCIPAICIRARLIPETKGKTLEEIKK